MNLYEIAIKAKSDGAQWVVEGVDGLVAVNHGGRKPKNGVLLDSFTASAVVLVHDGLNEVNRAKFFALPLTKAVTVVWKLVK